MIGNFLKRLEEKSRNPENVVKLREARQEITEKDKIIERLQQQNKELKERLGINDEEC